MANKPRYILLFLLFINCFGWVGYGCYYLFYWEVPHAQTVLINHKQSTKEVANLFAAEVSLPVPKMFWFLAKVYSLITQRPLQAGEYFIPQNYHIIDILGDLTTGKVVIHKLTIPEGYTTYQVIQTIDAAYGLTGDLNDADIKEGTLLPSTYHYIYGATKASIIKKMKKEMDDILAEYWPKRHPDLSITSPFELLTLASIVEREAKLDAEKPLIAQVYLNRLKIGMPLQADPTIIYALSAGKTNSAGEIAKRKLDLQSEYNTYLYKGLPPTPIAHPSKTSILAVLQPADNDYLYFVADGSGTGAHMFARHYTQHLNNIKISNSNSRLGD